MKTVDIVAFADTHGKHEKVTLPDVDVAVFAGDACGCGTADELNAFLSWYQRQPPTHKIFVAGNHDRPVEEDPVKWATRMGNVGITYLQDNGVDIDGVAFWGAPWTPEFNDWAFNVPRGPSLAKKWDKIPGYTDVLVTHGMPYKTGDMALRQPAGVFVPVGDKQLRVAVERVQPTYYIGGHLHMGYGMYRIGDTAVVNATQVNEGYVLANEPVVLQI
jgi:Icc-related predicted phosphoesterase